MNQTTAYRLPHKGLITSEILSFPTRWFTLETSQAKSGRTRKA